MQSQSMHTPPFPFMSKRKLPPSPEIRRYHPTSPTPLPKPTSSSSSSLMSARHRSSANSSPLLSISTDDSKRPPFWTQKGMVPFVDWITTPENHAALHKRRNSTSLSPSSSEESISQTLERLRAYVKEQSGVKWLQSQIRSKLQYAKKKYDLAGELGESHASMRDTDTAKLRRRMLELCPYYERFYAVYGGTPLPPATAPGPSGIYSSSSSSSAAAAAKAPYQFSTYSQVNRVGYTSPHESRHPRTSTLVRNPSPSPMDHGSSSGRYEREEEEEVEEEEAIDNYHQEYQSPLAGGDGRDDEEEVRDQSPEEEVVREPSEATYEMVAQQDMMSDHGHGSDYGAAPEMDSYRERSVALRAADKGKGSSKRHRTQWGGRYSHQDNDDRDTFMDDFKTVDSAAAAAGRIVWIEQDKERMRQLIRKEQMLEERESSWALRMLQQQEQHQAMLLKREEEAELRLKRRFEELEEERQQVRAMQQELAAREKEFYKERESWLAGYAVVKADAAKAAALYHAQN